MEAKVLAQEYEFSEFDNSPLKAYKPIPSRICKKFVTESPSFESLPHVDGNGHLYQTNIDTNQKCLEVVDKKVISTWQTMPRRVSFISSQDIVQLSNKMLKIPLRASLVSSLINAYGLQKYMRVVEPRKASQDELCAFHSSDYIEFLKRISAEEDNEKYDSDAQHFGLSYDCPAHYGVYEYTCLVSGATIQAAELLNEGSCDVAINWFGGWHHGKKDSASGFCYSNDIVLGILKLREKFGQVLYVDLDLHHGDGVEDAFCTTNKVMTVSVHKHDVGFFPGTGNVKDVGYGKGKYYSVNIPLKDGIRDAEFAAIVCRVLIKVKERFMPEVVVCQCGADGIAGDPMESFNLTPMALAKCIYTMLSWKLPMLLLGGGGYNYPNTARCWTYLTGVTIGKKLPNDIPEHEFLMEYGPDYELCVAVGNKADVNSQDYLQQVYAEILDNLCQLPW